MFHRRDLLKFLLFGTCCPTTHAEENPKWDLTVDAIVVGSGAAGLAAAATLAEGGLSVLMLEKMNSLGGNTVISGGDVAVPGSPVQLKMGIKDSPQMMAEDLIRAGKTVDKERVRFLAQNALSTWKWTQEKWGTRWNPDKLQFDERQSVPRGLLSIPRSGFALFSSGIEYARNLNVQIRNNSLVEDIFFGPNGEAQGLLVRTRYKFPDPASGTQIKIRARRAIVLCFGGFGADEEFREMVNPSMGKLLATTNQPGATAESIRMAMRLGIKTVDLDQIQALSWISADEIGLGDAWPFIEQYSAFYGIWVNNKGKRFVNERGSQRLRSERLLEEIKNGHRIFGITTQNAIEHQPDDLQATEELKLRGIIRSFPSLEALAVNSSISYTELVKTVEKYNTCVNNAVIDEFQRNLSNTFPLNGTNWFVVEIRPKVHHCMGGIKTTLSMQVLNNKNQIIPNLYAAGEATGGIFGRSRIPCHSLIDALVGGRAAGLHILENTHSKNEND